MLIASKIAFAAGLAVLGLAQGPVMLTLGWLVIGLGMGVGLYEAMFASLVAPYGRAARGSITGVALIAWLASTICRPVTALIDAEAGWRAACFFRAAALLAVGAVGAPAAILFTVAHGLGNGVLTIAKGSLPLAVFGPGGYGRRLGLLMAPARVAQAAAPLAFAGVIEVWGAAAFALSAALSLAGLAALMALKAAPPA